MFNQVQLHVCLLFITAANNNKIINALIYLNYRDLSNLIDDADKLKDKAQWKNKTMQGGSYDLYQSFIISIIALYTASTVVSSVQLKPSIETWNS